MRAVSCKPSKQFKAAAGYDDIDVEITDAVVHKVDYTRKDGEQVAVGVTVCTLSFQPLVPDAQPFTEDYSVGAMVPSEDGETEAESGEYAVPVDAEKPFEGFADNSRLGIFFNHLSKAGFPDERFDASVKCVVGVKGHLRRIAPPSGGNSKRQIPVISKLLADSPAGAKAGGGKATDIEALAKTFIGKVLDKQSPIAKMKLGQAANKTFEGKPQKAEVVKTVLHDPFLKKGAAEGLWDYDGRQVSKKVVEEADADLDVALDAA